MPDTPLDALIIGTGASVMRALGGDHIPKIADPITTPPEISGGHGRAWRCDLDAARLRWAVNAENDCCLDHWVVEAPWAHPIWHSYSLVLIHLRPLSDGRKTKFYVDGATHELWLWALDPDKNRIPMLSGGDAAGLWLIPLNFAAQFIEVADDLAQQRVRSAIQRICDGTLSPDTDFRSMWIDLFGNNMMKDRPGAKPPKVL